MPRDLDSFHEGLAYFTSGKARVPTPQPGVIF